MEEIQEQVERLIEEIEGDGGITTTETLETLYKIKTDIEDYNLKYEEKVDY